MNADSGRPSVARLLRPTRIDVILAAGAALLLIVALVALAKGHAQWAAVPPIIWFHILMVILALLLTPWILLRHRGDRLHRIAGYVWVASVAAVALGSFGIRVIRPGGFSPVHILSIITLIQLPRIVFAARRHDIAAHRLGIRILVFGALLIAGFFTLIPSRLLGGWLGS